MFAVFYLYSEFTFGDDVEEQQLGCAWVGDHIITLSLSGHLNYLDMANPSKPKRVVQVGGVFARAIREHSLYFVVHVSKQTELIWRARVLHGHAMTETELS